MAAVWCFVCQCGASVRDKIYAWIQLSSVLNGVFSFRPCLKIRTPWWSWRSLSKIFNSLEWVSISRLECLRYHCVYSMRSSLLVWFSYKSHFLFQITVDSRWSSRRPLTSSETRPSPGRTRRTTSGRPSRSLLWWRRSSPHWWKIWWVEKISSPSWKLCIIDAAKCSGIALIIPIIIHSRNIQNLISYSKCCNFLLLQSWGDADFEAVVIKFDF